MNIFGTVLTYVAPSSNYRGESEANRTVLQKISKAGKEFAVISPESMRNALREILAAKNLPCNRSRLHNEDQLAVEFKEFPDSTKYADDFFFGFMVADPPDAMKKAGRPSKRDSLFRMNLAVALTPYRYDATFHQSPLNAGASPWKNSSTSALLHKEVSCTAYQYPFAIPAHECLQHEHGGRWLATLLESIAELSNVAGGHARSHYEMSPRSIVVRCTRSLVAGFNTYGFDENGHFPELSRINESDLPGSEFWIGGEIVRDMAQAESDRLKKLGVSLFENPQKLLSAVSDHAVAAKVAK